MVIRIWLREFEMRIFIRKIINILYANILPISVFCLALIASVLITTSAQATINCAGYLPNSYFEGIENENRTFAGKLIDLADGTQQLQDLNGHTLLSGLTNAYIVMDKYLLASKVTIDGEKYGVVTATGDVIVAFAYDDIRTELDIATSFIVSVDSSSDITKQGIINRYGDWVYPLSTARIEHAHYDPHYDQDYFIVTDYETPANHRGLKGLLDDRGYWAIMPQYDEISPLTACTGKPLYLQVGLQEMTALINQNSDIIIPLATDQHLELFNNAPIAPLFLRSTLVAGSTATGMSEDIQDDIVSAQIIDANGKPLLVSDAPITKLLYYQLYAYKQSGKYGFIDDQAKIVLPPQFDSYKDDADKVWVEKQGEMIDLESFIELD